MVGNVKYEIGFIKCEDFAKIKNKKIAIFIFVEVPILMYKKIHFTNSYSIC